jgi:hypothetical protein
MELYPLPPAFFLKYIKAEWLLAVTTVLGYLDVWALLQTLLHTKDNIYSFCPF